MSPPAKRINEGVTGACPICDFPPGKRGYLRQDVPVGHPEFGRLEPCPRCNQQKLALARVLHPEPKVVVLDEPTRGVDVGAKRDIYFLIERLAAEGRGIVVVSSELLELIGLCHRVLVMRQGRLVADVPDGQLSEELLIAHATGTH